MIQEYKNVGIVLFLASCTSNVRAILKRTDFYTLNDASIVFVTVHDAVAAARLLMKAQPCLDGNGDGELAKISHSELPVGNTINNNSGVVNSVYISDE